MELHSEDRWQSLLGIATVGMPAGELRAEVGRAVRQVCQSLRQRDDRRGVAADLDRLQRIGALLEGHGWLSGK